MAMSCAISGLRSSVAPIPENSILPGDAELLERFGVSRTVLREALKTLAAKGLIQPKAKIGTRVLERSHWNLFDPDILVWHFEAGASAHFLSSIVEMRLALEPEAAGLAALRRTDAQLEKLYPLGCARWGARVSPRQEFVYSDLQFHIGIADASGNPFMRSISALIEVALVTTFTISSPDTQLRKPRALGCKARGNRRSDQGRQRGSGQGSHACRDSTRAPNGC